jgi:hypothetical protein
MKIISKNKGPLMRLPCFGNAPTLGLYPPHKSLSTSIYLHTTPIYLFVLSQLDQCHFIKLHLMISHLNAIFSWLVAGFVIHACVIS